MTAVLALHQAACHAATREDAPSSERAAMDAAMTPLLSEPVRDGMHDLTRVGASSVPEPSSRRRPGLFDWLARGRTQAARPIVIAQPSSAEATHTVHPLTAVEPLAQVPIPHTEDAALVARLQLDTPTQKVAATVLRRRPGLAAAIRMAEDTDETAWLKLLERLSREMLIQTKADEAVVAWRQRTRALHEAAGSAEEKQVAAERLEKLVCD